MLNISNSLSDTDILIGNDNVFKNPLFINPNQYDFKFHNASPAINATSDEFGNPINLGSSTFDYPTTVSVMISAINYNPLDNLEIEFIELYNPSNKVIDLTGYVLS